jgi:uncharacterized protein YodC (DUF2158 family)
MTEKDSYVAKVLSKNPKFEIGDVVKLKAGGPSMVIRKMKDKEVFCEWFDKATAKLHSFLKAQLVHTTPNQTPILNINFGNKGGDTPPWERKEKGQ